MCSVANGVACTVFLLANLAATAAGDVPLSVAEGRGIRNAGRGIDVDGGRFFDMPCKQELWNSAEGIPLSSSSLTISTSAAGTAFLGMVRRDCGGCFSVVRELTEVCRDTVGFTAGSVSGTTGRNGGELL